MRGLAAMLVVFFHFRSFLDNVYVQKNLGNILFGAGAFGVDLFFMISGFIIALSTEKTSSSMIFIIRRFFRIYPAFFVVFSIGALTVYSGFSFNELLSAMFFIHRDYSNTAPGFGFNILGPAWTLSYEIYFYVIFVFSMSINHRSRVYIASILIAFPVIFLQYYYNDSISIAASSSPNVDITNPLYPIIRFCSSPILLEFIIGMLFFEAQKHIKLQFKKDTSALILFMSVGIFLAFYFSQKNYIFGLTGFGTWSIILMLGMIVYDKSVGFNENKIMNFLGDISYSIYLSHYVVIKALENYRPEWWVSIDGISRFIAATTVCTIVAAILFKCVETPCLKLGKFLESSIKTKSNAIIRNNI